MDDPLRGEAYYMGRLCVSGFLPEQFCGNAFSDQPNGPDFADWLEGFQEATEDHETLKDLFNDDDFKDIP